MDGGLSIDQARKLKKLELENARLKRAVAELTLDKSILIQAAEGNFRVLHVAAGVLTTFSKCWRFMNAELAGCWSAQEQPGVCGRRVASEPPAEVLSELSVGGRTASFLIT